MSTFARRAKLLVGRVAIGTLVATASFVPAATPLAPGLVAPALASLADVGYRDYGYPSGTGGASDATAGSVQNKLWYHDGRWFGVLFDDTGHAAPREFRIRTLDMTTQEWTNTGVLVDDRNDSRADVVADGDTLYVASSHDTLDLRFYRFSYNGVSHTYTLDSGFPKTIANTTTGTGYVSIAEATSGDLWMVFPQKSGTPDESSIYYTTSGDGGATWSTPAVLPAQSTTVKDQDIAAITRVGSGGNAGVGVLWSDQKVGAFNFSVHLDSDNATTWGSRETAYSGTNAADNHISLKTDSSGRAVAAVKTSMTGAASPLIVALRRSSGAVWESHTVSTKSQDGTRPMLLLDSGANQAAVYMTSPAIPGTAQMKLYRHTAPLDTLDFGTPSLGSVVIANAADQELNNATSTKQLINGTATGQVVEVSDVSTHFYLHSCLGGPCPVAPVADFTGSPTSGAPPLQVTFTDASTNSPTGWSWNFGDGGTSTSQNPTHTYSAAGTYTVSLTASNAAGSNTKTRTGYINVVIPGAGPTIGPLTQTYLVRQTIGSTTTTVKLHWSATDPQGINRYKLNYTSDGGVTWHLVRLASPTSTSVNMTVTVGRQYIFRVTAWDNDNNASHADTPMKLYRAQQTSTNIHYTGTWRTQTTSLASGGSLKFTNTHSGSATYTFTGKSVGFVSWTGPGRGIVKIYMDGSATAAATIDLRSTSNLPRRLVFARSYVTAGTHTIKVVLTGTTGRWRADVDAFLFGR